MKATAKEIRQARAFLQQRGFTTGQIPPKAFANTAVSKKKTFTDLLKLIAKYQMGDQGAGQSQVADEMLSKKQRAAKEQI